MSFIKSLAFTVAYLIYFLLGNLKARCFCRKVSVLSQISPKAKFEKGIRSIGAVVIGARARIGRGSYVRSGVLGHVNIGRYCSISHGVCLGLAEHDHSAVTMSPELAQLRYGDASRANVPSVACILGDGCWIGANVVIRQGVTVGEGAVIGAGSVVTSNVPAFEIWGGVPARLIRRRSIRESNKSWD